MLAACSSPAASPSIPGSAFGTEAVSAGKLEVSRSGSGLSVRLINPKNGAASAIDGYVKDKAGCDNHYSRCYTFSAIDGTAPLPVSAGGCPVGKAGGVPTAFCDAAGVAAIIIDAPDGGTIGHDASSSSELGKDCFPTQITYEVGGKDVYSVLAWDGCKERVHCAGHNVGTVDADGKDVIEGPCYFVNRH